MLQPAAAPEFTPDAAGGFELRLADARVSLGAEGVRLAAGLGLHTARWGRATRTAAMGARPVELGGDGLVRLVSPGIVEWWRPLPGAIEQGWTVDSPPAGQGPLVVDIALAGAVQSSGPNLSLSASAAGPAWSVGAPRCWDSEGKFLQCSFSLTGSGFRISIYDDGATYPIEIDPIYRQEDVLLVQNSFGFGEAMVGDGDVNGDGYADVIIADDGWAGGFEEGGHAWVYLGAPDGRLEPMPVLSGLNMREANHAAVAFADVNGDGYDDVIGGTDTRNEAVVFMGPDLTVTTRLESDCHWPFGYSVANAGDFNGDGYEDVVVGSPENVEEWDGLGCVALYLGSPEGLATTPDALWTGRDETNQYFGARVVGLGDLDGDGYDDVGVTSDNLPYAYVFRGAASPAATATWEEAWGTAYGSFFLDGTGDVNGDGYDDVIGAGGRVVFTPGGPDQMGNGVEIQRVVESGYICAAAAGAGDVDGDGFADVLVSAGDPYETYVFRGSASGLILTPAATLTCGEYSGGVIAGAGDVDGDGLDDVLVNGIDSICLFLGSTLAGPGDTGFTTYVEPDSDSGAPSVSDDGGKSGCGGQGCGGGSISALLLVPGLFGLRRRT